MKLVKNAQINVFLNRILKKRFGSACTISRKNGWLDEFFPKDITIKEANDAFSQMLKSKEGKKAIEMIRKDIKNITI